MAGKTATKKTGNGRRRKTAAKVAPELVHEEGFWWIVSGNKRLNAGRNERYARQLMAEQNTQ